MRKINFIFHREKKKTNSIKVTISSLTIDFQSVLLQLFCKETMSSNNVNLDHHTIQLFKLCFQHTVFSLFAHLPLIYILSMNLNNDVRRGYIFYYFKFKDKINIPISLVLFYMHHFLIRAF